MDNGKVNINVKIQIKLQLVTVLENIAYKYSHSNTT